MTPNRKDLLARAIAFAHDKHSGQRDRQGLPYILHPLAVLVNVVNHDRYAELSDREREDVCCIAILHDVVEDTNATVADVLQLLGSREIASGVEAMTHYPDEPLEAYWSRVKANRLARIVKLCDLRHNADPARRVSDPVDQKRRDEKYKRAFAYLKFD